MSAVDAMRLLILLLPYVPIIADMDSRIKKRVPTDPLRMIFTSLAQAFKDAPADLPTIMSLLTGQSAEWIATSCTAKELWSALPVLDQLNDFRGLVRAARKLGLWDSSR